MKRLSLRIVSHTPPALPLDKAFELREKRGMQQPIVHCRHRFRPWTAKPLNKLIRLVVGLIFTATFPALAQPLPAGIEKVTAVEGITEYRLTNGLSVLLFPDSSKPVITVNMVFKVGSRHEGYGEKGMAHLLEHLDFKGTPKHPNIPKELSEHGAHANGTTWVDRTHYYETFDATEPNLRWALELEADRMVNSYIAKKDLDSEFSVVRNEYEMGENDPGNVLNKRMLPTMFQWHNYGRDAIGEKSDIEGAPIERLQAFYQNSRQSRGFQIGDEGSISRPAGPPNLRTR